MSETVRERGRGSRSFSRVLQWTRRFPATHIDPLITLGLLVFGALELSARSAGAVEAGAMLASTLPFAVRSRAPLRMLVAVLAVTGFSVYVVYAGRQPPLQQLFVVIAAAFSVGERTAGRDARVGLSLLVLPVAVDIVSTAIHSGPFASVVAVALFTLSAWGVGRLVRHQRAQSDALRMLAAELARDREERARRAVAKERVRIARDLHDVVAHTISVMVLQAGAARQALGRNSERSRDTLLSIERSGREALDEMRLVLNVLREGSEASSREPQPGLADLPRLVEEVRRSGVPVTFEVEELPETMPRGIDVAAYRIVQQALTNVLQHAGSRATADVRVRYSCGRLELLVADDGLGGSPGEVDGHGLLGMRERVALYRGAFNAGPGERGGFVVRASIPIGSE